MKIAVEILGASVLVVAAVVGGRLLLEGSPPAHTGRPTPPVDPVDHAPPFGGTPVPSPAAWQARTATEVAANMARDPFATQQLHDITRPGSPIHDPSVTAPARLGQPIFVKAFTPPYADIWLTPVLSGSNTVAVLAAPVRPDRLANADFYSGFVGVFPHSLGRADALAKASVSGDAAVSADLMWSHVGSRQGYPTGMVHPFWRAVRGSGTEVLVLTDGTVVSADQLR